MKRESLREGEPKHDGEPNQRCARSIVFNTPVVSLRYFPVPHQPRFRNRASSSVATISKNNTNNRSSGVLATTAADSSSARAECDSGGSSGAAKLSARQRNRLAREARSSAAAAVGKPGGGGGASGAKRRRGNGGDSCGGGKDGREDGPPAFLGQTARGSMLDVASNARETLVSLAADLVAQVRKGWVRRGGEGAPSCLFSAIGVAIYFAFWAMSAPLYCSWN